MLTLKQQMERDKGLKDLRITTYKDKGGYVFISYKSDNWKKVFEEKVIPLQRDYSLRVYSDKQFDSSNRPWLQNMDNNIKYASAVILFISKEYLQSYATFIELLTAINYQVAIIPVYLPDSGVFSSLTQDVAYRSLEDKKVRMNPSEKAKLKELINKKSNIPQVEEIRNDYERDIESGDFTIMNLVESFQKILKSGKYQDHLFYKPLDTLVNTIKEAANEVMEMKGESYNVFEKRHDEEALSHSETEPVKQRLASAETSFQKSFSVTGDITYSIYGKQYTDNQSNMMLNVFAKILHQHPEIVKDLPGKPGMNCVSHKDYTLPANRTKNMPSYFRICDYFMIGGGICVGTAYGIADKMKKIALLIDICGEDREIFQSDNELVQLPAPKDRASRTYREKKKQRRNFLED